MKGDYSVWWSTLYHRLWGDWVGCSFILVLQLFWAGVAACSAFVRCSFNRPLNHCWSLSSVWYVLRPWMREFSVHRIAHLISSLKISSFFLFDGIKHNLMFTIISFTNGVRTHFYAWALADVFTFCLKLWCNYRLSSLAHLVIER